MPNRKYEESSVSNPEISDSQPDVKSSNARASVSSRREKCVLYYPFWCAWQLIFWCYAFFYGMDASTHFFKSLTNGTCLSFVRLRLIITENAISPLIAGFCVLRAQDTASLAASVLPCTVCNKQFFHTELLRKHRAKHLLSHQCELCSRRFRRKSTLKAHRLRHDSKTLPDGGGEGTQSAVKSSAESNLMCVFSS